jgi:tripartite-type tricarboxylate transporter receptor subunit TctC
MVVESWFGILGPANLPAPVVSRLVREVRTVVEQPSMRQRLLDASADAAFLDPAGFAAFMAEDIRRWTAVVKATNIKIQD